MTLPLRPSPAVRTAVDEADLKVTGGPLAERRLGLLLLAAGLVGFAAAFVLTVFGCFCVLVVLGWLT